MVVRILPTHIINKIAAGEVIDRPLSVIKELIENSIDAEATEIKIEITRGGRNSIYVTDNGKGIEKDDIITSLKRHATSKLNNDITNIKFLGFRGEALPSIAAVSKLTLTSKVRDSRDSWTIATTGNNQYKLKLASHVKGTTVQVRDLFFLIPTRLKFLKSEASETNASIELVRKLALSRENISFRLISNDKIVIDTRAQNLSIMSSAKRIIDVLGTQFIKNSIKFSAKKKNVKIYGYTSTPELNASTSLNQYFFINRRSVKDKVLSLALKTAYKNFIPKHRFAKIVLYLDINPTLIDVNIHPSKAQVKFRNEQEITKIVIKTLNHCISRVKLMDYKPITFSTKEYVLFQSQLRYNNTINSVARQDLKTKGQKPFHYFVEEHERILNKVSSVKMLSKEDKYNYPIKHTSQTSVIDDIQQRQYLKRPEYIGNNINQYRLGFAKCQIGRTYIVTESSDCIVLVNQHAAHARLAVEQAKNAFNKQKIQSQELLVPKIISLGKVLTQEIIQKKDYLKTLGIIIELNNKSQLIVKQLPYILHNIDMNFLIKSLAKSIYLYRDINLVQRTIYKILGDIAWRSSICVSKRFNLEEMNKILRQIEQYCFTTQSDYKCLIFVKLNLQEIEEIFKKS